MSDEIKDSVVARCPKCQRLVMAVTKSAIDSEIKREIGRLASVGRTIESLSTEEVRKSEFGCKCKAAQPKAETVEMIL